MKNTIESCSCLPELLRNLQKGMDNLLEYPGISCVIFYNQTGLYI